MRLDLGLKREVQAAVKELSGDKTFSVLSFRAFEICLKPGLRFELILNPRCWSVKK